MFKNFESIWNSELNTDAKWQGSLSSCHVLGHQQLISMSPSGQILRAGTYVRNLRTVPNLRTKKRDSIL